MKTLYVIGNGFDIHHKLDTRYQNFANYLTKNDNKVYDQDQLYKRFGAYARNA